MGHYQSLSDLTINLGLNISTVLSYPKTIWVDPDSGKDITSNGFGRPERPWKSIQGAIKFLRKNKYKGFTVIVFSSNTFGSGYFNDPVLIDGDCIDTTIIFLGSGYSNPYITVVNSRAKIIGVPGKTSNSGVSVGTTFVKYSGTDTAFPFIDIIGSSEVSILNIAMIYGEGVSKKSLINLTNFSGKLILDGVNMKSPYQNIVSQGTQLRGHISILNSYLSTGIADVQYPNIDFGRQMATLELKLFIRDCKFSMTGTGLPAPNGSGDGDTGSILTWINETSSAIPYEIILSGVEFYIETTAYSYPIYDLSGFNPSPRINAYTLSDVVFTTVGDLYASGNGASFNIIDLDPYLIRDGNLIQNSSYFQ